jgi:Ca2+-binding EF-hand superfamily protein
MILGGSWLPGTSFDKGDLPEFLQRFDTNNDDQIDEEERQAIRDLRSALRQEKRQSIDADGDGTISSPEIASARKTIRARIEERRRRKFALVAGEDGMISPSEYAALPGIEQFPEEVFEAIWSHLDLNQDGLVSLAEFTGTLRLHR